MTPWDSAPLDELVTIVGGGTPARTNAAYYGGTIPWVTPKDMKTWEIYGSLTTITQAGLDNGASRLIPANSVLLVLRSGILKHTLPIGINRVPVALNQDMKAFVCGDRVYPDFLARFIKSESPRILQWVRATTADNLPLEKLRRLSVPLPPLEDQRRIASLLDRAEAIGAKRLQSLSLVDDLGMSVFIEMFGDPVLNSKGWPDGRALGEIAEVVSGVTVGRKVRGSATREIRYLAVVNVQDQRLDLSTVKTIHATDDEIERYRLQDGDLLLTEGGDPDKLGRGCLWSGELPECIHQNHIFRVRVQSGDVTPQYLNWLVGSPRGKSYFLRSAKQTTGIASINSRQLRAFPVLVPPLSLQKEFGAILGRRSTVEGEMAASRCELDALFASLQFRAFRGDL